MGGLGFLPLSRCRNLRATEIAIALFSCSNAEILAEVLPVQQVVLEWKVVELLALDKEKSQLVKALQQELEKPQVSIHWVYLSASLAQVWEHLW